MLDIIICNSLNTPPIKGRAHWTWGWYNIILFSRFAFKHTHRHITIILVGLTLKPKKPRNTLVIHSQNPQFLIPHSYPRLSWGTQKNTMITNWVWSLTLSRWLNKCILRVVLGCKPSSFFMLTPFKAEMVETTLIISRFPFLEGWIKVCDMNTLVDSL